MVAKQNVKLSAPQSSIRRSRLLLGVTALLLSLLAMFGLVHAGRWAAKPNGPGAEAASLPSTLYKLVPGQHLVYELNYTGKAMTDFSSLMNQRTGDAASPTTVAQQTYQTALTGQLVADVILHTADKTIVAYRLPDAVVQIIVDGQEATTDEEQARAGLSSAAYATLDQSGRVVSVRFAPDVNTLAQSLGRTLIAAIQFTAPPPGTNDPRQWQAEEEDTNGKYLASYQRAESSSEGAGVLTFKKTKLNYLQPRKNHSARVIVVVPTVTPQGQFVARFDSRAGHLIGLDGTETQTISASGHNLAVSEISFHCNRVASETLSETQLETLRSESADRAGTDITTALYAPPNSDDNKGAAYSEELGSATLESLLKDLAAAEANPSESNGRAQLYSQMRALVYLHPEVCPALAEVLRKAAPNSLSMQVVLMALSASGQPAAQATIAETMQARGSAGPELAAMLFALGSAAQPSEASEALLREISFSTGDTRAAATAQLALGMMASNLESAAPDRAEGVVELLITRLDSSSDVQSKSQLLAALGNTGMPDALAAVACYLQDATPDLRAAALTTLCRSAPESADAWLDNTLTHDPDTSVRLQAAREFSLVEMGAAAFSSQKRALLADNAVEVRLTLLSNLWQARSVFPEVRQLVKQLALKDGAPEVRKAAANLTMSKS